MDELDRAQRETERHLQRSLINFKHKLKVAAIGQCLNCFEPLNDKRRWCDADCRNDWQKRRRNTRHE